MSLSDWQQVVDVLLKGVATVAIAAGGLYLTFQNGVLDRSNKCSTMASTLYDDAAIRSAADVDEVRHKVNILIGLYQIPCGKLPDAETQFLLASITSQLPAVAVSDAPGDPVHVGSNGIQTMKITPIPAQTGKSGWLVIGKINGTYGQINFDHAEPFLVTPVPAQLTATLPARWGVNLRANNSDTDGGSNPILDVVNLGDCVSVSNAQLLRNEVWAQAKEVSCP